MGLQAQEEALSKLNFIKNGKHDIDEGILVGYTQQNLLRNIGKQSQLLADQCRRFDTN